MVVTEKNILLTLKDLIFSSNWNHDYECSDQKQTKYWVSIADADGLVSFSTRASAVTMLSSTFLHLHNFPAINQ